MRRIGPARHDVLLTVSAETRFHRALRRGGAVLAALAVAGVVTAGGVTAAGPSGRAGADRYADEAGLATAATCDAWPLRDERAQAEVIDYLAVTWRHARGARADYSPPTTEVQAQIDARIDAACARHRDGRIIGAAMDELVRGSGAVVR